MNVIRLINLALQFTTRLPGWPIKDYSEKELGQSGVFFPLIGLLVGTILYLEFLMFDGVNIVTTVILLVISEIIISGGLHLDGFMDTMDGVMSGASGERMLTIMADSNVGAHSVSMLFVLILSKIALLVEVLPQEPIVIFLLPFVGRMSMLLSIIIFPYPKKSGIGIIYKEHLNTVYVILTIILSLSLIIFVSLYTFIATLLSIISIFYFAKKIVVKIGGLTGDVYGAIEEMSKVFFLFFIFITYLIIGR